MASLKVKVVRVNARMAWVLKETLEAQKPENLRDARLFIKFIDVLSAHFNFVALTAVHKEYVKDLTDARTAAVDGRATVDQEALLRMTNEEWFAQLHAAFDSTCTVMEVPVPVEAGQHVTKWLEKQQFNILGARLMVAFCDMFEDAPETVKE